MTLWSLEEREIDLGAFAVFVGMERESSSREGHPSNRTVAVDALEVTIHDVGRLDETTGIATTRCCVHLRGWSRAESLVWTLLVVLAAKQVQRALCDLYPAPVQAEPLDMAASVY